MDRGDACVWTDRITGTFNRKLILGFHGFVRVRCILIVRESWLYVKPQASVLLSRPASPTLKSPWRKKNSDGKTPCIRHFIETHRRRKASFLRGHPAADAVQIPRQRPMLPNDFRNPLLPAPLRVRSERLHNRVPQPPIPLHGPCIHLLYGRRKLLGQEYLAHRGVA